MLPIPDEEALPPPKPRGVSNPKGPKGKTAQRANSVASAISGTTAAPSPTQGEGTPVRCPMQGTPSQPHRRAPLQRSMGWTPRPTTVLETSLGRYHTHRWVPRVPSRPPPQRRLAALSRGTPQSPAPRAHAPPRHLGLEAGALLPHSRPKNRAPVPVPQGPGASRPQAPRKRGPWPRCSFTAPCLRPARRADSWGRALAHELLPTIPAAQAPVRGEGPSARDAGGPAGRWLPPRAAHNGVPLPLRRSWRRLGTERRCCGG